jgi:hypothetical protein
MSAGHHMRAGTVAILFGRLNRMLRSPSFLVRPVDEIQAKNVNPKGLPAPTP